MKKEKNRDNLTPVEKQYLEIKDNYKDCVLLYRMGDFYEGFDEDARILARVLGITLTSRAKGDKKRDMAGVPWHALEEYLPKLAEAGLKVAIADQLEDASLAKGLVKRGVTRVVTPGTLDTISNLDSSKNSYILLIYISKERAGYSLNLSYADLLSGVLKAVNAIQVKNLASNQDLESLIEKLNPKELIVAGRDSIGDTIYRELNQRYSVYSENMNVDDEKIKDAYEALKSHLEVSTLKGFGIGETNNGLGIAVSLLYSYLTKYQQNDLKHIKTIQIDNTSERMNLDISTIKHLELIYNTSNGGTDNTLLESIDQCKTPMGRRLLRQRVISPFIKEKLIVEELDRVDLAIKDLQNIDKVRDLLDRIYDIERLAGKIGNQSIMPKDLNALKNSLKGVPSLLKQVSSTGIFENEISNLPHDKINELIDLIEKNILEEPSSFINQGRIFNDDINDEIKELRSISKDSKQILADIQMREINSTGINTLKVKFNKVFGYYIEVSKAQSDKVPSHYERKQTLVNAERYITTELKELEEKILTAEDKLIALELEMYTKLRNELTEFIPGIQQVSNIIARVDVLYNTAFIANDRGYVRPIVGKGGEVKILEGRHPMVEISPMVEQFIPNDYKNNQDEQIMILTGPNMSGKSTFIRQIALIQLMFQMGCYVPAREAKLRVVDKVFTRIGSGDNLSMGESTFMIEMIETANILNNATSNSLIILDEVGRGTSTYDGVAIAWAIVEYISKKIGAMTLFATHYHELVTLETTHKGIVNYHVDVIEEDDNVIFLYKIRKGGTSRSYGIHVADMAGIPSEIIDRSESILMGLEQKGMFEIRHVVEGIPAKITKSKKFNKKTSNKVQQKLI